MNVQNERIKYLKDKIYNGAKVVYIDDDMIPDTFAQDMKCIFGCNPETDILCGVERGGDSVVDCTLAVIEKSISREDFLVVLSDYVNALKLDYILCAMPDQAGSMTQYELDPDDEYVEGPVELYVGDILVIGDNDNLLIEGPLKLGLEAGDKPSAAAEAIAEGKHFTKELYDVNDDKIL